MHSGRVKRGGNKSRALSGGPGWRRQALRAGHVIRGA